MDASRLRRLGVVTLVVLAAVAAGLWLQHRQGDAAKLAEARERVRAALETGDAGAALGEARAAREQWPDDPRLLLDEALALQLRDRHGDALALLAAAPALDLSEDEASEARFLAARSRIARFLATGERADFNLGADDLRRCFGGRFGAQARLLLGQALARPSPFRDPAEAKRLLEEGLSSARADLAPAEQERLQALLASLDEESAR